VTCSHTTTIDIPRIGKSITFTGTPTITIGINYTVYGSMTLAVGMTYTPSTYSATFRGRSAYTLTTAGKTFSDFGLYAPSGTLTLQDAFTTALDISVAAGTFTTNNQTISARQFYSNYSTTRVINLSSSTMTLTYAGAMVDFSTTTGLTFNAGTSTIILSGADATARSFVGAGLTYYNVTVAGAGAYVLTISGNNTFNTFTVDASEAIKTVTFTDGTTQTMSHFKRDEGGTNVITLNGTGAAGWALILTGNDSPMLNYMSVSRSTVTPSNVWFAGLNSTNGGNNSGWVFGVRPQSIVYLGSYQHPNSIIIR
jgi:hypothetical protein